MKKILLLSAVLLGAVSASQAGGIHFGFGFGIPLPGISIGVGAPVVTAPPAYYYPPAPAYQYAPAYSYPYPYPAYSAPPAVVVGPRAYWGYGPGWYRWWGPDRHWHWRHH